MQFLENNRKTGTPIRRSVPKGVVFYERYGSPFSGKVWLNTFIDFVQLLLLLFAQILLNNLLNLSIVQPFLLSGWYSTFVYRLGLGLLVVPPRFCWKTILALWRFMVIASDSSTTGTGMEMIDGIRENERYLSLFFGQLDTESIGSIEHSHGGTGSINTAVDDRVKRPQVVLLAYNRSVDIASCCKIKLLSWKVIKIQKGRMIWSWEQW